jgi:hypothetical protein
MNNRVVVRSLVTPEGNLVAMDDGTIVWRPLNGLRRQIKIEAIATVLLAMKGPNKRYEMVGIGDSNGGVTLLSLPMLEVVERFSVQGGIVRSLCVVSTSVNKFLASTQDGAVWLLGPDVPSRTVRLFSHNGPITSLRLEEELIHIQSGWNRRTYDWTGETRSEFNHAQEFELKAEKRANRRARILESQQRSSENIQPLMLDLPALA